MLGVAEIGTLDDFFHLGGDSLRAVRVATALRRAGWGIALQDFFAEPTVAALARAARAAKAAGGAGDGAEARFDGRAVRPALPGRPGRRAGRGRGRLPDRRDAAGPWRTTWSCPAARTATTTSTATWSPGAFDPDLLRRAIAEAMDRHPVLRTSLDLTSFQEPLQLVHGTVDPPLVVRDLRHRPEQERAAEVRRDFDRLRDSGFALDRAPLFAVLAHRLGEDSFQLTIAEHHAILDGWSFTSLLAEILHRHAELLADPAAPAAPAPRSGFRDLVAAERAAMAEPELAGVLAGEAARRGRPAAAAPGPRPGAAAGRAWRAHHRARDTGCR